jgi:hypothetical protein
MNSANAVAAITSQKTGTNEISYLILFYPFLTMHPTNSYNLPEILDIERLFRNFTGLSIVMPEHSGLSDIVWIILYDFTTTYKFSKIDHLV